MAQMRRAVDEGLLRLNLRSLPQLHPARAARRAVAAADASSAAHGLPGYLR